MGMNGFFGPRSCSRRSNRRCGAGRGRDLARARRLLQVRRRHGLRAFHGLQGEPASLCVHELEAADRRAEVGPLHRAAEGAPAHARVGRSRRGRRQSFVENRFDPRRPGRTVECRGGLAGFNDQGDQTSHLGVEWPYPHGVEMDISAVPLDSQVVGLLQAFTREMHERGVTVFISYSPVAQAYYDQHKRTLDEPAPRPTRAPPAGRPEPARGVRLPQFVVLRHRVPPQRRGPAGADAKGRRRSRAPAQASCCEIAGV